MTDECPGPWIWFGYEHETANGAVLECATCRKVTTTGNWNDEQHAHTPWLMEGLSS
jgi:hypothetical protein